MLLEACRDEEQRHPGKLFETCLPQLKQPLLDTTSMYEKT